jgi:hypothetical protein
VCRSGGPLVFVFVDEAADDEISTGEQVRGIDGHRYRLAESTWAAIWTRPPAAGEPDELNARQTTDRCIRAVRCGSPLTTLVACPTPCPRTPVLGERLRRQVEVRRSAGLTRGWRAGDYLSRGGEESEHDVYKRGERVKLNPRRVAPVHKVRRGEYSVSHRRASPVTGAIPNKDGRTTISPCGTDDGRLASATAGTSAAL